MGDKQRIAELNDMLRHQGIYLDKLEDEYRKLQELNKNMHTCVSGYLKGAEWDHWQKFNEPRFILK